MAYMYVPDEIAGKLEIINDICKIKNEDIKKVVEDMAKEESYTVESLHENALRFKLFAKDIAKGYKEAVSEEVDFLGEIWEECESKRDEAYKKTEEIKNVVSETKDNLLSLQKSINELNIYGMERVLELLHTFNGMSDSDKELLKKLAEISG